jgi:CubicO group peptidase (beta-lactamase class C family)
VGRVDAVRRRLDDDLPRLAAGHEVPGVSVAVLVNGQVLEGATGVVNLRTGVAVTPDSVFMIQSVAKVWTATLVMQLVDDGLIELDVPVRAYLPGFRTADERASARITVRHLLTHTGGFEGDIWAPTTSGPDALQRFVDDLVSRAPQPALPGKMYSYCSAGYGVLGHLVEVLRGTTYEGALRRYLARPLGVEEIAFSADEALAFRTAIGHVRHGLGAAQWPLPVWALMPQSNPAAGNQLAMSARALLSLASLHVADGLAPDGTRVLSTASAQAMREWQVSHPAEIGARTGRGLGWVLTGQAQVAEHGGGSIGVGALLRLVPGHRVAVAVLANGGEAGALTDDLASSLLGDLADVEPAPPLPSPAAGARVPDPRRYTGCYQSRAACCEVTVDTSGRLWLTRTERHEALAMAETAGAPTEPERCELRQADGDLFVLTDPSGAAILAAEFLGPPGPAQFFHLAGRAAPRTS